ncbi:MAG: NHLP bacteriocin export ABC transporter permease/ATPase subunit [Vicinamibacteria bacterium]|nr:NHLP bacteriocin export ABC transporter permease/ATPase subunit [Vicinamibacteria bacterium]
MDPLRTLLEAHGEEIEVSGNHPLLLADPEAVWHVSRGHVEVFSIGVLNGAPAGSRRHFFSAPEGDVLLGLDPVEQGQGLGLLAVGVTGTRLRRAPLALLAERARTDEALAAVLAPALDRWVGGLSVGAARTVVPKPRADVQLQAGEAAASAKAGQRVKPRRGVLWVDHEGGAASPSLFIGMEEIPEASRGGFVFPLAHEAWLQPVQDVRLLAIDTAAALSGGRVVAGLRALTDAVFRCEFFNSRLQTVDELNRLREKAARDRAGREKSLAEIQSVLTDSPRLPPALDKDDALLAAATLVGQAMGIEIKAPPKPRGDEAGASSRQPLDEIVRTSRIRSRVVTLKGEWWKTDGGPFLGKLEEGQRPVAILPISPFAYEIQDPATGTRVPVTEAVAATLEGQAVTFYRSLPDHQLGPRDLMAFAVSTCRQDLKLPLLVGAGAGVLGMLTPYFMGVVVQDVIPEAAQSRLVQMALILATVAVVTALFEVVKALALLRIEAKMTTALQPAVWDRLLTLPSGFFRQFSSGDLAMRALGIDQMRRLLSGVTITTLMTSVFSSFTFALLFYYSWKLALFGVGLVLVALTMTLTLGYFKVRIQRQVVEVEGRISGLVLQLLAGIAKLRVTGAESRAFSRWASQFTHQKRLAYRTGSIENFLEVFNSAFPILSSLAIFYAVLWLQKEALEAGQPAPITPGEFVAFNSAFASFLLQSLATGMTAMSALNVVPLWERARPILETKPEVDLSKADPGEVSGLIEVSHVTFRYQQDGPTILNDVSLRIEPGEFVALVGPSGSGKSTLLRMLLGLDVPETGSVYYDGRDLQLLDVQKLRRKIGVVSQNATIRSGSVFSNIIGSLPLTLDDAWEAARMAGLDEDVKGMPMGMNTVLQQGGGTLSGGQRQRLIIARAIVSRPRILFFDEATSALDNRTQAIVSQSLMELQATRIAVAHRLSTIIGAHRIYVLAGGRIVQQGSYQELVAVPGMFQDLVKRQVA